MRRRTGSGVWLDNGDDFIRDSLERPGREPANLGNEQALVRGKELGLISILSTCPNLLNLFLRTTYF